MFASIIAVLNYRGYNIECGGQENFGAFPKSYSWQYVSFKIRSDNIWAFEKYQKPSHALLQDIFPAPSGHKLS